MGYKAFVKDYDKFSLGRKEAMEFLEKVEFNDAKFAQLRTTLPSIRKSNKIIEEFHFYRTT